MKRGYKLEKGVHEEAYEKLVTVQAKFQLPHSKIYSDNNFYNPIQRTQMPTTAINGSYVCPHPRN